MEIRPRIGFLVSAGLGLLFIAFGVMPGLGRGPAVTGAGQPLARNVELIGQVGGATQAVAVAGSYAYVGVGPQLVILDISDPAQPAVVGRRPSCLVVWRWQDPISTLPMRVVGCLSLDLG